jgi:homeobox-leucine zipper protein
MEGGTIKEEVRVANGVGSEDSVSIIHVKVPCVVQLYQPVIQIQFQSPSRIMISLVIFWQHSSAGNKETTMILQNCSYDAAGSFLVYSALDKQLMDMITKPEDGQGMFSVPVFPTGFSFVPIADAVQPYAAMGEAGGTVMTAGFQLPMKLAPGTGLSSRSVASAIRILMDQIECVKNTLTNSHPAFYRRIPPTI